MRMAHVQSFLSRVCLVSIPEKWSHFKMKMSAMYFSRLLALRVKFFVGKLSTSIIWTWVEGSISFIAILCIDKSWWIPGSAGRHTCGIRNSPLEMRNLANHLNLESNSSDKESRIQFCLGFPYMRQLWPRSQGPLLLPTAGDDIM